MGKKEENAQFICASCKRHVLPLQNGSYRNHCPFCLTSLHVDNIPGDRKNGCHGLMKPLRLVYRPNKGWQVVHKCKKCGHEKANKIAEGCLQPDNWDIIIGLS